MTELTTPRLGYSAHCGKVENAGLTCMCCGEAEATGHVQIFGTQHDGRVLLLLCPACSSDDIDRHTMILATLHSHVRKGVLDPTTCGPGPNGGPEVWHKDHWDPMTHEEGAGS